MSDEWLEQIKVGDAVFMTQSYGLPDVKATVSRLTATRIMVKVGDGNNYEYAFRKQDGRSVGSGPWDTQYLREPTPEREERRQVELMKAKAVEMRGRLSIPTSKKELVTFIEAMKPFVRKENDQG